MIQQRLETLANNSNIIENNEITFFDLEEFFIRQQL